MTRPGPKPGARQAADAVSHRLRRKREHSLLPAGAAASPMRAAVPSAR